MVERDRKAAGKKAANTNRDKDPHYYPKVGSTGGVAVNALKRAFSAIPGLAQRAALARFFDDNQGVYYSIEITKRKSKTRPTRAEAREVKRQEKANGFLPRIFQIVTDEKGYVVERKEVW
jgi:hypothetical protein